MSKYLFKIFLFVISFSLLGQGAPLPELDVDSHLKLFEKYNVVKHDNIDDNVQTSHTHSHTHGDGGDEHEHDHEHSKITQLEIKLISSSEKYFGPLSEAEHLNGFSYQRFASKAHPLGIFRPPIV